MATAPTSQREPTLIRSYCRSPTVSIAGLPLNEPVGFATGALNTGGNFFASATNYFNTFEGKDNISWNHGKHTIRAGCRGGSPSVQLASAGKRRNDFPDRRRLPDQLERLASNGNGAGPNGILANFYGSLHRLAIRTDQRTNEFAAYTEDDIKVTSKLTLNLGLRWEYDGYPSDVDGPVLPNGWA